MLSVDTEINNAIMELKNASAHINDEWVSIRKIGPLEIFVRRFEPGKVEVKEKINNITYACYIKTPS